MLSLFFASALSQTGLFCSKRTGKCIYPYVPMFKYPIGPFPKRKLESNFRMGINPIIPYPLLFNNSPSRFARPARHVRPVRQHYVTQNGLFDFLFSNPSGRGGRFSSGGGRGFGGGGGGAF